MIKAHVIENLSQTPPVYQEIENSLDFEYIIGGVSRVSYPYSTTWRTLPHAVVAQWKGGRVRLEIENKAPTATLEGEALFIAPGVRHKVDIIDNVTYICCFAHLNYRIFGALDLFSVISPPERFHRAAAGAIGDLCEAMVKMEHPDKGFSFDLAARKKEAGFRLLGILCGKALMDQTTRDRLEKVERLSPVLAFLRKNPSNAVDRDALSKLAGLSPTRFHYVFKEAMGMAPMAYAKDLCMREAGKRLLMGTTPIKEVALELGYQDQFHFSKDFRKHYSQSPSEYRLNNQVSLPG